jgi:hypothetical protein
MSFLQNVGTVLPDTRHKAENHNINPLEVYQNFLILWKTKYNGNEGLMTKGLMERTVKKTYKLTAG